MSIDFISESSFWFPEKLISSAWVTHAPFAFWLTESIRPKMLVELGTHNGFSYFSFCQAVMGNKLDTSCFAVDTWKGDEHSYNYGEEIFAELFKYNNERYSQFSRLIRSTFDDALKYFADASIDLLHIDGFHTYEAVKHDFQSWLPKLSSRAVVLFHDTNVRERDFGVFKLWNELQDQYPSFEFLHGHGLGVLGIGKELPEKVIQLFAVKSNALKVSQIRGQYDRLGASMFERLQICQLAIEIESLKVELERYRAQIPNLEKDISNLENNISNKDTQINRMQQTISWKITSPLRWLRAKIR